MTERLRIEHTEASSAPEAVDLVMPSDVGEVEHAIELLARHCFQGVTPPPCQRTTFRLRVTLAEALSNAIIRGNGEDPAKSVRVRALLFADSIRVSVKDEGPGFDPGSIPELNFPEALESEQGRGLTIIKNLADQVEFSDRGSTIWMTLPRC